MFCKNVYKFKPWECRNPLRNVYLLNKLCGWLFNDKMCLSLNDVLTVPLELKRDRFVQITIDCAQSKKKSSGTKRQGLPLIKKNRIFVKKSNTKTISKIREVIDLCLRVLLYSVSLQPLKLYNLQERYLFRKAGCIFRKKSTKLLCLVKKPEMT